MENKIYLIHTARAEYTGWNIWIFYGTLDDGCYFLVTDDGDALLFNTNPEIATHLMSDEWDDWMSKHLIEELKGRKRTKFQTQLCNVLMELDIRERGWIFDDEILAYKKYWKESC